MAEEQLELGLEDRPIEPESGNPIPAGGIPSDVKDDKTIKASEGEMVIPAHVVRYLGVGKLEKMIKSAENDLAEMEEAGRMGQPTNEEEGDDDEVPFTDEELLSAMEASGPVPEFNQGGLVAPPAMPKVPGLEEDKPERLDPKMYRPFGDITNDPNEQAAEESAFSDVEENSKWADPTGWETKDFGDFLSQGTFTAGLSKAVSAVSGPLGKAIGDGYSRRGNMAYSELLDRLADPELAPEERKSLTDLQTQYEEAGYKPKKEGPSDNIIERALDAVMGGERKKPSEDLVDERIQETRDKTQEQTKEQTSQNNESDTPSDRDDNNDEEEQDKESSFSKGGLIARKKKKS